MVDVRKSGELNVERGLRGIDSCDRANSQRGWYRPGPSERSRVMPLVSAQPSSKDHLAVSPWAVLKHLEVQVLAGAALAPRSAYASITCRYDYIQHIRKSVIKM